MGSNRRRRLNQSTHSRVAYSTGSNERDMRRRSDNLLDLAQDIVPVFEKASNSACTNYLNVVGARPSSQVKTLGLQMKSCAL